MAAAAFAALAPLLGVELYAALPVVAGAPPVPAPFPVADELVAVARPVLAAGELPVAVEPCAETVGAAAVPAIAKGVSDIAKRIAVKVKNDFCSVFISRNEDG